MLARHEYGIPITVVVVVAAITLEGAEPGAVQLAFEAPSDCASGCRPASPA